MPAASAALGPAPRRVFLTVGQQDLAPFGGPHHYVVRSVDPPAGAPAGATVHHRPRAVRPRRTSRRCCGRMPIEILVTKNSGGSAVAGKLAAARALRLPVVHGRRPPPPGGPIVPDAAGGAGLAARSGRAARRVEPGARRPAIAAWRPSRPAPACAYPPGPDRPGASVVMATALVRPADRGGEGDGVSAGRIGAAASSAAPSCQGRAREAGCRARCTNPAAAAARSRSSTTGQGLRLSDSEIAQKSCPSGAPSRAAAASRAEMPGTTSMSSARQRRMGLHRLEHRRRHAEHPGVAARHDRHPAPGGGQRQRVPGAVQLDAVVRGVPRLARPHRQRGPGRGRSRPGRSRRQRRRRGGASSAGSPGPRPTT